MRSAILRGREHTRIGALATVAEGAAAIALSRGGAKKTYSHREPNEDVAAFAFGPGGVLITVADGHGGCEAAEIAVDRLLDYYAPRWTAEGADDPGEAWAAASIGVLRDVHARILDAAARDGNPDSRTTLAFALVRADQNALLWASAGDSHVFHVGEAEAIDLVPEPEGRVAFLGSPAHSADSLADRVTTGCDHLEGTSAVVIVSDGLSESGIGVEVPESSVGACAHRAAGSTPDLRPLETARAVVEEALDAHRRNRAGDNVASAVAWLERA